MATRDRGLPAQDGPDEPECAWPAPAWAPPDRSIVEQRRRLKRWEVTAADRLAPRPVRDRAAALAAGSRAIIDAHDRTTVSNNQTREH
ncbi:hypothetical protein [Streptomyces sp. NPDC007172]|uniref:hypothetical protein n=1 Tax=Streptomyces sp. NPDC007172 TaxID=3364776 RepID=UPI0036AD20E0